MKDYMEAWQMQDAVTTVANANGYGVWDLHPTGDGFVLELDRHISDEAAGNLCGQMPLTADYCGEGTHGTMLSLHR